MNTFLYREGIQRIKKYLFFMRKTAVLADVCIPIIKFFVSMLFCYFDDKE